MEGWCDGGQEGGEVEGHMVVAGGGGSRVGGFVRSRGGWGGSRGWWGSRDGGGCEVQGEVRVGVQGEVRVGVQGVMGSKCGGGEGWWGSSRWWWWDFRTHSVTTIKFTSDFLVTCRTVLSLKCKFTKEYLNG